jgi:hypothetical protein
LLWAAKQQKSKKQRLLAEKKKKPFMLLDSDLACTIMELKIVGLVEPNEKKKKNNNTRALSL